MSTGTTYALDSRRSDDDVCRRLWADAHGQRGLVDRCSCYSARNRCTPTFPNRRHEGESPGDKIASIRESGYVATTSDTNDSSGQLASVEVSAPKDGLQDTVWTFYKTLEGCQASVHSQNTVPDRYR